MSPPARKPRHSYHHGDLREALIQAALLEAEQGGPEAISINALAKTLGVSQPAPYRHFADREALLVAVTAAAFRQFNMSLREALVSPSTKPSNKTSGRSKLSRLAQAALVFGLKRRGIYRLMFASQTTACAAENSELHMASRETLALVKDALDAPVADVVRERHALQIWAALHGVVMLAQQGLLTGKSINVSREQLVEDMVAQTLLSLQTAAKDASARG
jgi:AcrR family transcriptional regulator